MFSIAIVQLSFGELVYGDNAHLCDKQYITLAAVSQSKCLL